MGNQIHCSPVPGRIKSKLPTNMFKVKNINEQGEVIWRGVVEVSRTELVLHQKVGDPVRWPLKSLRRYGFDKGLFSFESGRSCATGPGIYAFKCKDAEQLFNLVKSNTNSSGTETPSTSNSTPNTGSARRRSNPAHTTTSMPHNHTTSMSTLISTNGRIAGRGATSPVTPTPNDGSPTVVGSSSSAIEYINSADLRETGPPNREPPSQPLRRSPIPPVKNGSVSPDPAKQVSLNYARLKLGQDEDDAVNVADGSLTVVTADIDRAEGDDADISTVELSMKVNPSEVMLEQQIPGEFQRNQKAASPRSPKDENDNRVHNVVSKSIILKEVEPNSCRVKTGLLVEIGSEVNRLSPARSPEVDEGQTSYMNLDRSPKVLRHSAGIRNSPDLGLGQDDKKPTSPKAYYTNLDTKDELPPHSAPPTGGRYTPASAEANKGHMAFNFNGRESPQMETSRRSDSVDATYGNVAYINNVGNHGTHAPKKTKLNYIQVAFEDGTVSTAPHRSLSSSSSGGTPPQTPNSPSTEASESPNKVSEIYAVIDTNKTVALANSQRQINDGDIATRRTRHDVPQNR